MNQPDVALSRDTQNILDDAEREAGALHDGSVGPEHMLLAALKSRPGGCARIFDELGLRYDDVRRIVDSIGTANSERPGQATWIRPTVPEIIERAGCEASAHDHAVIMPEDLLLGLEVGLGRLRIILSRLQPSWRPDEFSQTLRHLVETLPGEQ